ncbi:hypothetical protein [Actinomadura rupiterrae]|uniref:hypothetical protein n=1 Tax=Actinomadura rupiterrae TaxID=559627 RepID=UPI0020A41A90|nr:hypothetical protein [Actinomadura rupiterrae]MCP2337529.1 hypothetical protein [Actinomadura rupiterrae]
MLDAACDRDDRSAACPGVLVPSAVEVGIGRQAAGPSALSRQNASAWHVRGRRVLAALLTIAAAAGVAVGCGGDTGKACGQIQQELAGFRDRPLTSPQAASAAYEQAAARVRSSAKSAGDKQVSRAGGALADAFDDLARRSRQRPGTAGAALDTSVVTAAGAEVRRACAR